MMAYLLVAVGGALGSLARFILGREISRKSKGYYPLGTFIINITGAVSLGILSAMSLETSLYTLLGDGFLGAYTTLSTFMYEGFSLFHDKRRNAIAYVIGSLVLGVMGYLTGMGIVRLL